MMCKSMMTTILLLGVVPLVQCSPTAAPGGSSGVAKRYLTAMQHKDFKTVTDLTEACQDTVRDIRKSNPQVLWTRLIAQYYASEAESLAHDSLLVLLPPSAQLSITEQRPGGNNQTSVYATVRYTTPSDSPVLGQNRLKQAILQLTIFNPTQHVVSTNRVEAADVYWPIPSLSNEEALRIIKTQLPATALSPYINCNFTSPAETGQIPYCTIRMPQNTTPWLSTYTAFYERQGFVLKPFQISEGWGANTAEALPPRTWSAFLLTGDGDPRSQTWNDRIHIANRTSVSYRLPESSELLVDAVTQKAGYAKVAARLVHSGCTPVCAMIREYWRLGFPAQIVGNTDPFFLVYWKGNTNEDAVGVENGKWPTEENRSIELSWDAGTLSWYITNSSELNVKF
jgi:hypothetical protein